MRYPDDTEIMPQVELRFIFDLYAGVRPARLIPGVPSPIVGADQRGIDLVLIRELTEGLFASMGKGVVTHDEARETLVITRKTSQRLFEFSFRLAERRKARGRPGKLACVDKANAFKAYAFFREIFDECAARHPEVTTERLYVDACAAMLVRRPWDFDVLVTENMFGDILSDLTAGLIGGMGMAPSADIGDTPRRVPALPRHRARHHGQGHGQPIGDDPVDRDDARLARRQARPSRPPLRRAAHRGRRRRGLCARHKTVRIRRQRRHWCGGEGGACGAGGIPTVAAALVAALSSRAPTGGAPTAILVWFVSHHSAHYHSGPFCG